MKCFLLICLTLLFLTLFHDLPNTSAAKAKKVAEEKEGEEKGAEDKGAEEKAPAKKGAAKKKGTGKSCTDMVAAITKRQIAAVGACTTKLKFKDDKEKGEKVNCILKCALQKEKLLGKDGQAPNELWEAFMKKEFPPDLETKANKLFGACRSTTTDLKDDDELCKSYEPLIKCATEATGKLCTE